MTKKEQKYIKSLKDENDRLRSLLIRFMDAVGKLTNIDDVVNMSLIPIMTEETKRFKAEFKAEAYKEFAEKVQGEIDDAIHSNYNAKEERQAKCKKFGIPIDAEDSFLMYCDGKIKALSGINSYIDNILNEIIGE